ncbi:GNAT family N-acetyltransferase [Neisseria leonii]|uniref:GNAT family N-acetyltransferase n=1 Tax=Neisseria leonii TaxID=2995413 RepID=UPI00237ACF83|nr:GNAT family N-acetyltransferase [Neisseria sp. 3986]MDD9325447.1 GNAT family N-acetyltransferase [Neisseria sp. 3986]
MKRKPLIRPTEPHDYEGLYKLYACPEVCRQTLQLPDLSAADWQRRLAAIPDYVHSFVAADLADGQILGNIALTVETRPRRRHAGSLVMAVRPDCHRQGIGSVLMQTVTDLADNWLNLARLELQVFTDNAPAVALYRKSGFETEGVLQDYAYRNGRLCALYSMARLRRSIAADSSGSTAAGHIE